MKLTKRKTSKRVIATRIGSPETRINPETQKRELLLAYVDEQSYLRHVVTNKDLFLYAAGSNEEGDIPDGLDRLMFHRFVVHLNDKDEAIGLDIIPARVYRSGVVPESQRGVDTVSLTWELGGAVCRVIKRPAGTKADTLEALVRQLDKMADSNTPINTNTKIGTLGKVARIDGDIIEVKLSGGRGKGAPVFDLGVDEEA